MRLRCLTSLGKLVEDDFVDANGFPLHLHVMEVAIAHAQVCLGRAFLEEADDLRVLGDCRLVPLHSAVATGNPEEVSRRAVVALHEELQGLVVFVLLVVIDFSHLVHGISVTDEIRIDDLLVGFDGRVGFALAVVAVSDFPLAAQFVGELEVFDTGVVPFTQAFEVTGDIDARAVVVRPLIEVLGVKLESLLGLAFVPIASGELEVAVLGGSSQAVVGVDSEGGR